ncbi:MAG: DUF4149 domain-containing protein [Ktedonobacteraceae bacterium]|nr:DUF4149 domain-containing protein [Ktedonobacteraceae bacterium]
MLEIRLIVRAAHILAAATWVGGSLMYLVVVVPALRRGPIDRASGVAAQIAVLFKQVVNICTGVLLLSGAYLTFDRLTQTTLGMPYILVLCAKISAALAMFVLAIYIGQSNMRRLAKRSTRFSRAAPQLILALGILVFVLGAILNAIYETSIAPH